MSLGNFARKVFPEFGSPVYRISSREIDAFPLELTDEEYAELQASADRVGVSSPFGIELDIPDDSINSEVVDDKKE